MLGLKVITNRLESRTHVEVKEQDATHYILYKKLKPYFRTGNEGG
jgi:hypothetical protein